MASGTRIDAVLPRIVVTADCQSEVIERGRSVAVVGLLAGQIEGQCDSVTRLPLS